MKTVLSLLLLSLPMPALAAETLATANAETEGIRIDVTDLKRGTGDVVTLKFTIVNDSKQAIPLARWLAESTRNVDAKTVSGVHLADPSNKRKFFVIRDEEGNPLCSTKVADVAPGARASFWAKFPAPTAKAVSVVVPHFEPLDDVPVR